MKDEINVKTETVDKRLFDNNRIWKILNKILRNNYYNFIKFY